MGAQLSAKTCLANPQEQCIGRIETKAHAAPSGIRPRPAAGFDDQPFAGRRIEVIIGHSRQGVSAGLSSRIGWPVGPRPWQMPGPQPRPSTGAPRSGAARRAGPGHRLAARRAGHRDRAARPRRPQAIKENSFAGTHEPGERTGCRGRHKSCPSGCRYLFTWPARSTRSCRRSVIRLDWVMGDVESIVAPIFLVQAGDLRPACSTRKFGHPGSTRFRPNRNTPGPGRGAADHATRLGADRRRALACA